MAERFTPADVDRLARLARIAISEEERTLFAAQLADILAFAEQVQAVDTAGIAPFVQAPASSPSRADEPTGSLSHADALATAPATDAARTLFKVPRVLG
jgi:aspartyl-tRNA(Asn)/glutamyl-tRNA(Gln) amidotransferase subunit C